MGILWELPPTCNSPKNGGRIGSPQKNQKVNPKAQGILYTHENEQRVFPWKMNAWKTILSFLGDLSGAFTVKLRLEYFLRASQKKNCYDGVSVRNQVYICVYDIWA